MVGMESFFYLSAAIIAPISSDWEVLKRDSSQVVTGQIQSNVGIVGESSFSVPLSTTAALCHSAMSDHVA